MLQRCICKCPIFPTCLEQVSPPVLVLFAEYFENEKFQTFKQVYKFGLELCKLWLFLLWKQKKENFQIYYRPFNISSVVSCKISNIRQ